MASILVVEDEKPINELLYRNLTLVGHRCLRAYDGEQALGLIESVDVDLILLDIMLPGMSGLDLMRARPNADVPVIFLTAKSQVSDRVAGLNLGADDYIVKPFETIEVIARIQAVLRRTKRLEDVFALDQANVDLCARKAYCSGEEVELTPQEYALLEALILNRWGYDYMGDTRTVDVHVQKLRKKLGLTERIKTVYKLGYRLETPR
ncbi:MAG: response regulator transcription factor [Bacillota bacterium]